MTGLNRPTRPIASAGGKTTLEWAAYFARLESQLAALAERSDELANMPRGNDSYTKCLLHFDGADASTTFTDVAYGALTHAPHVWTAAGNAQIDTAESKFGGASYLGNGSGDRISTPDHADFALGSDDFTIEAWFNANGATGGFYSIASQSDGGGSDSSFLLLILNSDVVRIQVWVGSTTFQIDGTTQFNNATNTGWHHVAAVRTGNTLKLFIDGVQEGGDEAISGAINDSAFALTVGARSDTFTSWNGWIDEFRLSVGIARWTANFTPPTLPYGPMP